MLILKSLSHWIFRILSTLLGIACFWSTTGESELLVVLLMGAIGSVFLSYGLFRNDLLDCAEKLMKHLSTRLKRVWIA
jgi:4-hydroxybenzoate polyprenyltransferase